MSVGELELPSVWDTLQDHLFRIRALEALVFLIDTEKFQLAATTSGYTTVIAADPDFKIRVISLSMLVSSNVDVFFARESTAITGLYSVPRRGGMVLPENPSGWFETDVNERLRVNLSASVTLGGSITIERVEPE